MGASALGKCFSTSVEAAQAECATYPRSSVDSSGVVAYSCSGAAADGSALALVRTDATGASSAQTLAVSFPPCDELMAYDDAVTLWGAGIAALVAVWCAKAFVLRLVSNQ